MAACRRARCRYAAARLLSPISRVPSASPSPLLGTPTPQGFFGGLSLEGAVLAVRKQDNEDFYGGGTTIAALLAGAVAPPEEARRLHALLTQLCGSGAADGETHGYGAPPMTQRRAEELYRHVGGGVHGGDHGGGAPGGGPPPDIWMPGDLEGASAPPSSGSSSGPPPPPPPGWEGTFMATTATPNETAPAALTTASTAASSSEAALVAPPAAALSVGTGTYGADHDDDFPEIVSTSPLSTLPPGKQQGGGGAGAGGGAGGGAGAALPAAAATGATDPSQLSEIEKIRARLVAESMLGDALDSEGAPGGEAPGAASSSSSLASPSPFTEVSLDASAPTPAAAPAAPAPVPAAGGAAAGAQSSSDNNNSCADDLERMMSGGGSGAPSLHRGDDNPYVDTSEQWEGELERSRATAPENAAEESELV